MSAKPSAQGSKIARRTAARLSAVQAVYQMKSNDQTAANVIAEFQAYRLGKPVDGEMMVSPDAPLFSSIVQGVSAHEIDLRHVLETNLQDQKKAKPQKGEIFVEPLLWSILMCGAYELLAHHDTDAPVIISDYLEVTHAFYDGGESKLVNGVLDKVAKVLRD